MLQRTHTKIVFTTSTRAMKTTRLPTLILAAILSGSALGQPYDITGLSKAITASEGELVEIVCPSSNKITNCIFRSPVGETYFMNDGEQFENERIVNYERTDNRCGMRIRNLGENDNGLWECTLGLKNPDTKISSTMKKTFELEIAVKTSKDDDTEQAVDKEGSDTESTENPDSRKTSEAGADGATLGSGDGGDVGIEDGKQDDTKGTSGGDGDGGPDVNDNQRSKVSMATKMTNLFAAVKKPFKSKSDKYEQSESEAKLNEDKKDAESGDGNDSDKKDGEDYAELDQNALNAGPRTNFNVEDEKKAVQYAEIRPQQ